MPSIFSRIIAGELPGRFVWRDEVCVAFLSIAPLRPGHTLVVPIEEVDHWIDLDGDTASHLMRVAQAVGCMSATIIPRSASCGSAITSPMSRTDPHGTLAARSCLVHSSRVRSRKAVSSSARSAA